LRIRNLCILSAAIIAVSACTSVGNDKASAGTSTIGVAELAAKPDDWVLQQVGGKRIVLDGQTLDLRMQYLFHKGKEAEEAEQATSTQKQPAADPFDDPKSAAEIRAGANNVWIERTKAITDTTTVTDDVVTARDGKPIPIRIYRPRAGKLPVLVYYHGGGWLFGNIAAIDLSMRRLAQEAGVIIVSADYRLAPETPYPGPWNDAEDAFGWTVANAAKLDGDPSRICVGGDSAGGNMSVVVTARAQKSGKPSPACQLLFYAAVDNRSVPEMRVDYASARLFWDGFGLDVPFTEYVLRRVFPGMNLSQPEISPIFAGNFAAMPPTIVVAAGFDPLRDSDRAYAKALKNAGVQTVYLEYPSLPHGFLQQTAVSADADRATGETSREFGKMLDGLTTR
jgi:acetyl esterase